MGKPMDDLADVMIRAACEETGVSRNVAQQVLKAALTQADHMGWRVMPMHADSAIVGAYLDHLSNPARSVESTWRRMADATPNVLDAACLQKDNAP